MRTVTVVDDEPVSLDVLMRAARGWRYECQAAASAEQAIQLLESNLTPIVVTDLRMPGKGGVWLVREIKRRWPHVGVIVVTAGQDEDALAQCVDAGARHCFVKPVRFEQFEHALESSLRAFQVKKPARRQRRRHPTAAAIEGVLRVVEARDSCIAGHSRRVRRYALLLADGLHLPCAQRRMLSLAARLHDIGKVGLPDSILHKAGPLTRQEFDAVKVHPVLGERILQPILRNDIVLKAIRGHHERYDGAGYPDGFKGDQIPLLCRILSIADCYDALTSSRAYRLALGHAEARRIVAGGSGSQFDPRLVPVFLEALARV